MWISFPFYHGQLVGWQKVIDGRLYEILPINGRSGYEVHIDESWCGETFGTLEEAMSWVDTGHRSV